MPLLTPIKVVTKEQAILNMRQERIIALQASHNGIVMPPGLESATYKLVLQCLRNVVMHPPKIRVPVVPRHSPAPVPPTSAISLAAPKPIDFKGYVHLFKQITLSKTEECLLSDMMAKSPTALRSNINDTSTDDDLDPLIWVHIPLNNTAWVNVGNFNAGQDCMPND
jgi:hypothetical protein